MKPQVEIFQIDQHNLRCGWCQAWLDTELFMGHANQHLIMLEQLRDDARLTITIQLPDPEDDPYNVEDL